MNVVDPKQAGRPWSAHYKKEPSELEKQVMMLTLQRDTLHKSLQLEQAKRELLEAELRTLRAQVSELTETVHRALSAWATVTL